jgi:type I restriction enzyme S subunit
MESSLLKLVSSAGNSAGVLDTELVKNFVLLIPKQKTEQKAISKALSDVDGLIDGLTKLIAKKRDIKTATMQQLLTGKTRLPGFGEGKGNKQTELGEIPEDWKVVPMGEISSFITKGSTPTTYGFSWEQDGILFLRSECVSKNGLELSQSMFISEKAHSVLNRSELRSGDILITITGNVGRVVLLNSDFGIANMNQHIARIRINIDTVYEGFVYHYLNQSHIRKYYNTITTGLAYPQISLKQVRETPVPLPVFGEQQAIAQALSDMDQEIETLQTRLNKTKSIKQGMMQELLTGKTRLI